MLACFCDGLACGARAAITPCTWTRRCEALPRFRVKLGLYRVVVPTGRDAVDRHDSLDLLRSRHVHVKLASRKQPFDPVDAGELKSRAGWNDPVVVGWQACLGRRADRSGHKAIAQTSLSARKKPWSSGRFYAHSFPSETSAPAASPRGHRCQAVSLGLGCVDARISEQSPQPLGIVVVSDLRPMATARARDNRASGGSDV